MTNYKDILTMSKTIKEYFVKNKTYPKSVMVKGTEYTIQEATYLMSSFINNPTKEIDKVKVTGASNPNGDRCNRKCNKKTYTDMANRTVKYVKTNRKLPNYVEIKDGQKCSIILWMFQLSKICTAYATNNKLPDSVLINSKDLEKPKNYSDEILDYFTTKFGKVSSIDEALGKIQGRGYGFYYNDKMTNKQVINCLADPNAEKPNCTDVSQMMWHIGKALDYDVRAIHVMCQSGVGHIRLQFNRGDGWFNRDPAAVIDGECIQCIWCSNGTYLATNPQWFMTDLNK